MEFPRQEYWSGSPFPSSGIKPGSPALSRDHWATREAHIFWIRFCKFKSGRIIFSALSPLVCCFLRKRASKTVLTAFLLWITVLKFIFKNLFYKAQQNEQWYGSLLVSLLLVTSNLESLHQCFFFLWGRTYDWFETSIKHPQIPRMLFLC